MFGYDYGYFKIALAKFQDDAHQELLKDIESVKKTVEVWLEKICNSTSFSARAQYPGLEI